MEGSTVSEARKDDAAKPRMDLIPPEALITMAAVLTHGAQRYGDRNWERGLDRGRIVSALLRHLTAWMAGEDDDQDSGMPHSWHVLTNAAFLVAHEARGIGADTRALP